MMKGNAGSPVKGLDGTLVTYSVSSRALEIRFPSKLNLASEVIQAATAFGRQFGVNPLRLSIVLRELLRNAIEHGNREDSNREVTCTVACDEQEGLRITVRDEGEGFDFSKLDLALPDNAERLEHRGFILVNAYTSQLNFNDTGNEITALMTLPYGVHDEHNEAREVSG